MKVFEKLFDKIFEKESEEVEAHYSDSQGKIHSLEKQVTAAQIKQIRVQRNVLNAVADTMDDDELSKRLREIAKEVHVPKSQEEQAQVEGLKQYVNSLSQGESNGG